MPIELLSIRAFIFRSRFIISAYDQLSRTRITKKNTDDNKRYHYYHHCYCYYYYHHHCYHYYYYLSVSCFLCFSVLLPMFFCKLNNCNYHSTTTTTTNLQHHLLVFTTNTSTCILSPSYINISLLLFPSTKYARQKHPQPNLTLPYTTQNATLFTCSTLSGSTYG